ncbi:MAG: DUF126 domain-containing protein [bacterium]
MAEYFGKRIVGGRGEGPAIVTRMPVNFTAAFTKIQNIFPGRRAEIRDRHHDLFGKNIQGSVLVFPTCIGSTHSGLVLLEISYRKVAPAAMIVRAADSLLASGAILGQVWYGRGIPLIEYHNDDFYDSVRPGDFIQIDGDSGKISIL